MTGESWSSPVAGPWPSGHLIVPARREVAIALINAGVTRCGRRRLTSGAQRAAFTAEPPSTVEGRTCESCLRLANRDHRALGDAFVQAASEEAG